MSIILFDNQHRKSLYPFTIARSVANIRMGIFTMQERWEKLVQQQVCIHTEQYLQPLYHLQTDDENIWIDATVIPTTNLVQQILSLKLGEAIIDEQGFIAGRIFLPIASFHATSIAQYFNTPSLPVLFKRLQYPWQIFQWNDEMIRADFELIKEINRKQQVNPTSSLISVSSPVSNHQSTNQFIGPENIFIEEGASVEYSIINASTGPVYIGKDAIVMEGCIIRGPFSMGTNSMLKAGTKIYGATTLGPNCLCGGEIKNSVLFGNSNKAHDGYMGDSVIGEWCNWGAGTCNSNVKNTAGIIRIKDGGTQKEIEVGMKCGVFMGDYTRVSINSSINTGSVFGVSCNVFGAGLLPKVLPDFSWGLNEKYRFEKAVIDIENWKKMKHQSISDAELAMLEYVYNH